MASKLIYPVVAVLGIAAASGFAWWYQTRPTGPTEITAGSASPANGAAIPPAGAASGARAAGVEVAKVQRLRLQDDAQSVGSLRSRQSVMLRPEVAGRVKELGFSDGAFVRRGQMLVQLDDTLQRAEIRQAAAQVSIAQANFRRNQELVAQGFVAQRVLDESAANLQVAEAQLSLGCARFMRMAIVAPFDGTVGIRNVNLGDYVKDGADLINLEDTSSMYVDFRLPERFQGKLQLRQPVELQIDAIPGRIFKATVEAIDPLLDVNGRSVGVRAILPNSMGEAVQRSAALGAGAGGGGAPGTGAGAGMAPGVARPGAAAGPAAGAGSRPGATPGAAGAVAAGGSAGNAAGAQGTNRGRAPAAASAGPSARMFGAARAPAPMPGCTGTENAVMAESGAPARPAGSPGAPLRPGMFARVTTVFAVKESAMVIPEEAIVPQGGRQFVIKVVPPTALPTPPAGEAASAKLVSLRQEVRLGARQLGKVEIVDGLAEGDTVVVAGHQRLQRDGTPVRVVELGRPAGGSQRPASAPAPAGGASAAGAGAGMASAATLAGS